MEQKTTFPTNLSMKDFDYDLPEERIAGYPLAERDASKLLVWKEGQLTNTFYKKLAEYLPSPATLVMNNSLVVEARILFQKPNGGQIEIFCLNPHSAYGSISVAMAQTGSALWTCLVGGASKWKPGQVLVKEFDKTRLEARFIEKRTDDFVVEFTWTPTSLSFVELLHQLGSIPLPPYLKRRAEISDKERYQTLYASEAGSVAAPTAGLHFSEPLFRSLGEKKIIPLYITLHVGAGTFMPVKSDDPFNHQMHDEYIEVGADTIKRLLGKFNVPMIAVGTTSLRTIETLYWLGLMVSQSENILAKDLHLDQWYPYRQQALIPPELALEYLLKWVREQPGEKLITKTQLFIVPGYQFKILRGLITNFHQPQSTLLLLIAALIGPSWKSVYEWALKNDYRFLSYGDGCLFLLQQG